MDDGISILFWANRARKSQKTFKAPVYARVTIKGKRAEISTGKSVEINNWIPSRGRVKGSSEEARTTNRFLDNINVRLTRIFDRMDDAQESISAKEIKNRFLGKKPVGHSLIELFKNHNEQIKNQIGLGYSPGTLERYETTLKHLQGYLSKTHKANDIDCEDLKYSFIADFDYYLKTEKKIGHNTTVKYLRNFKKIVLLALKNEWIERDPFIRFKLSLNEVKKDFLNKEELQRIIEKDFGIDRLAHVRDAFIFCCFTGLAYADVQRLTFDDIQTGLDGELWIMVDRKKTGIQSHIPLLPEPARIIDLYKSNPESVSKGRILPVLSNQKVNAYLKEIGDLCGITKNITFHMARHTFATTVTLSNGVSIESVSSMLGHKSIRTTQIYAKVVKEKVSREMNELKDKLHTPKNKLKVVAD
jgi:site-specific recombinase XerD